MRLHVGALRTHKVGELKGLAPVKELVVAAEAAYGEYGDVAPAPPIIPLNAESIDCSCGSNAAAPEDAPRVVVPPALEPPNILIILVNAGSIDCNWLNRVNFSI